MLANGFKQATGKTPIQRENLWVRASRVSELGGNFAFIHYETDISQQFCVYFTCLTLDSKVISISAHNVLYMIFICP